MEVRFGLKLLGRTVDNACCRKYPSGNQAKKLPRTFDVGLVIRVTRSKMPILLRSAALHNDNDNDDDGDADSDDYSPPPPPKI